ncbi:MAG TPA: alpha/beta hydrolase [Candidatus Angelobacter sp.]|jgi:acetyl esterase|nr:alpha/beta hydrolase [Candidatus Angelobacter sp.]
MNREVPVLDPKTEWFLQFLKEQGRPEVYEMPIDAAREMQAKAQALFAGSKLPVDMEDRTISAGPEGKLGLRIFRPVGSRSVLPAVMYFHGGGWVLGDVETYDRFVREIANGADAAVVFVEYDRAPEEHYPVPVEECYAATKWVADHASEIRVQPGRIAVAGDSAGGNIAAAVTMLAKERGGPRIAAQVLIYPATTASCDTPSFEQFASGYYLTRESTRWFWRQYVANPSLESEPTACPLKASLDQLKGLPPALIITAECDVLRDEGELYARKLMQAGVSTTCTRYMGAIHGFMGINALAEIPVARSATAQMNEMLRQVFDAKVSEQKAS